VAPEVGGEIGSEDGLAGRFGLALAEFLVPCSVEKLILGEEEVSFVFVALMMVCV